VALFRKRIIADANSYHEVIIGYGGPNHKGKLGENISGENLV
jgi:hypothetical protein